MKSAIEVGGTIGGFSINETDLTATNFVLNTATQRLSIGSSDNIIVADADEGLSVGNALGSAPFRVNREGNVVASVTITGEVNATSGTAPGLNNRIRFCNSIINKFSCIIRRKWIL